MRVSICFGGSTFNSEELEIETLEQISQKLKELKEKNHDILVTVGGGKTAKNYIEAGKKLGISHKELDQIQDCLINI